MTDETTTNLVEGADTSSDIDTNEHGVGSDAFGTDTEQQIDDDGNPIAAEPEEEEVELDDLKLKVPKDQAQKLREAFLRQADYTRKTQEVADARKAFEAERATFHQAGAQELSARAQVVAIDQQIAQYQNIDWDAWEAKDPFAAQSGWRQFQTLQNGRQQAVNQVGQLAQARTVQQQQETAKRLEEGRTVLARDIKGWSPQLAETLLDHGVKTYGFNRAEIEEFSDPRMVKVLHDAFQFQALSKKTQAAQSHVTAQKVEPAAKVARAAAPVQGLDDRLSIEEWNKRRTAQVLKKA